MGHTKIITSATHGKEKTYNRAKIPGSTGIVSTSCNLQSQRQLSQKKKYKRTNNDLQNIHIKLKVE